MADKRRILRELQKRVKERENAGPAFVLEEFCFPEQLNFIKNPTRFKTAVCSRRCLAKGTLVYTTKGPKKIEEIRAGEYVYDENGKPVEVIATYDNGIREARTLIHNKREYITATEDHVFLVENSYKNKKEQKAIKDFNSRDKLVRVEIFREHGIHNSSAYALAALLGDGCSTHGSTNRIYISSNDDKIPKKVAEQLETDKYKKSQHTYTWAIHTNKRPNEYDLWCKDRKAHQKIADLDKILSWNRESRLQFFAGLLDTDGSISNATDGLQLRISMQALSVIKAAQMLFLDLWGYLPTILTDSRNKYKNGPVYNLNVKNNYFCKKALKELDPYLVSPQKKWKPQYECKLENNYRPDRVGVIKGKLEVVKTYDISVRSNTNLYLLANGIVTHNSGKTIGIAADVLDTCTKEPNVICLYITLTFKGARSILWPDLKRLIREYNIKCKVDDQRLEIRFPNGSEVRLSGAKDETEIEKFRGLKLKKVYIDEMQSFRPYVKYLINDILLPALRDLRGSLIITGTPGPIPAGPFYEYSQSPNMAHHAWTAFDNPHMHNPPDRDLHITLAEERLMKGIDENDPGYIRETYGRWVEDSNALVFKFNKDRNITTTLPPNLTYIFGIDIGYEDSDAIAVVGFDYKHDTVYLVEEFIKDKQTITDLVKEIERLDAKYKPVKMVMDAGALGKKIQEEIRQRHAIPVEAADKHRKFEFIELMNDDLRTGRLKALPNSRFEEDCYLVQWDRSEPGKLVVSDTYHSDINDAVLYAWRESKHYIPKSTKVEPAKNTDVYMQKMEEKEAEELELRQQGHDLEWGVEDEDLNAVYGIADFYSQDDEF